MNYWYSSHDYEIFLDLDSNRAVSRALSVLRVALRQKQMPIKAVWLYSTPTPGHSHMIITLTKGWGLIERMAWALWMGNDRLRTSYVLRRWQVKGSIGADLLVSKYPYHRIEDSRCDCTEKHKEPHVTEHCPAMKTLLGEYRSADFFSRTGKAPSRKKIRIPWGRVSLNQIRNWSENGSKRLLQDHRTVGHVPGLAKGAKNRTSARAN